MNEEYFIIYTDDQRVLFAVESEANLGYLVENKEFIAVKILDLETDEKRSLLINKKFIKSIEVLTSKEDFDKIVAKAKMMAGVRSQPRLTIPKGEK